MAAAQPVRSEVEKSEDSLQEVNLGEVEKLEEEEDPVKEVIRWVVKALLREEEQALVSDMLKYRNNLSRHLLIRLSELEGRTVDLARFGPSFKEGWQEWKKQGEQPEASSFAVFLNAMNAFPIVKKKQQ